MREIKAYVRREKVEEVIDAIMAAGVPGLTLIDVCGLGAAAPGEEKWSIEYCKKYSSVVKLEIVCHNKDVDRITGVIRERARTGHRGDGMIFVAPLERAIRIRTGDEGYGAIEPSGEAAGE